VNCDRRIVKLPQKDSKDKEKL